MTAMILLREWQQSQVEFWRKTIFEGYDVSNFGEVRSWRTVTRLHGTSGGTVRARRKIPKILKQHPKSDGYMSVAVRDANVDKIRKKTAHRLVATTFLPNPDNLPEVNHKNGIKADNRLDNLEWKSKIDNVYHAWDNGLFTHQKYSDDTIRLARTMYANGSSTKEISEAVGISYRYIGEIVSYKKRRRVA